MWIAGKPLKVKTSEGRYEDRQIGDPVPEVSSWSERAFRSHRDLGWIVKSEEPASKPVRRKRRRKSAAVAK